MRTLLHTKFIQLQRKVWHDMHINENVFQEGNWALSYDSSFKYFKGKLMKMRLGPYLVEKYHENGAIQIKTIYEEGFPYLLMIMG